MQENNWFPLPRRDGLFILGLLLYTVIFFSPWTYNVMILNISLLAWGAYLLCILAPLTGIMLALKDKEANLETNIEGGES
ncbi:hypothetical protein M3182_04445 [Mesobacillus maritimus]|uniref:hypothetical protein n=1 Tax=Mesobacillus maritimus TaxID=1643336 RepID=UPI00203B19C3|nr:hypothetical protein [Mesobacillus maritimus]MCM3584995.1 hypothetical protein [Mesobacillus maritimus]